MKALLHNNFQITPFESGFKYSVSGPDGSTDVMNYLFEEGFIVNHMVSDMSRFTNENHIGQMNYIMIDCTVRGRMVVEHDQGHLSLSPGSVVVYRPVTVQSSMTVHTKEYESITIGIDLGGYHTPGNSCAEEDGTVQRFVDRYGDTRLWPLEMPNRSMSDVMAIRKLLDRPETRQQVHVLVNDILGDLTGSVSERPKEMVLAGSAENEDRLYGEIASSLDRPCNIQEACRSLGMDRYNICSSFSKVYGDTPYAFHKHQRLLDASGDLVLGDETIGKIAEECGFHKEDKFAKEFQKLFGCTPRRFRDGYRELFGRYDDLDHA
ncbi:MAG: helix-turn-helix transcriptional regulator [Candidatus Methanomethylophilaceae archaeon]|nr:helix-turn-helix transcriptional regulator [Candidatus Methanomethylophilaceae archaeon]